MSRSSPVHQEDTAWRHCIEVECGLPRIDSGRFGYCLESGWPDGLQRLLARLTAEYCLEVQEARERQERVSAL